MGRKFKEGLDYFELDCQMDDKIKLIQAEFGLKGFAVVVKLFQRIYGERGYYCEWNEDSILLFTSENGLSSENKFLIQDITEACIRRGLFSEKLYRQYGILTSHGIQERYINAVSRRESVKMEKAYLLVDVVKNNISVDRNKINVSRNEENADRSEQSREEKSREEKEKILEKKAAAQVRGVTLMKLIEERQFSPEVTGALKEWVMYKKEKRQGYKEAGFRALLTQVEKMAAKYGDAAVIEIIAQSMSNGYMGITWENIGRVSSRKKAPAAGNRFNNFPQRDNDYDNIEKQLLGARKESG